MNVNLTPSHKLTGSASQKKGYIYPKSQTVILVVVKKGALLGGPVFLLWFLS